MRFCRGSEVVCCFRWGEGGEAALRGTYSQAALGNDRDDRDAERGEAELRGTHSQAELGNDKNDKNK